MKTFDQLNYYELLEIPIGASHGEVKAGYERAVELFNPEAIGMYGTGATEDADRLIQRLKDAFETLSDSTERERYDSTLGLVRPKTKKRSPTQEQPIVEQHTLAQAPQLAEESALAQAETALAQLTSKVRELRSTEAKPKPVEIPADAKFSGELLKQLRLSKGVTVQALAERTKIGSRHIEAIENERKGDLPATVYLRGMLMSLARELGLDPLKVASSYLEAVNPQAK